MTDHPAFHAVKHAGDLGAVGVIAASFASWLPSIASLLSILWFLVRFYDRWKYGPAEKRRGKGEE